MPRDGKARTIGSAAGGILLVTLILGFLLAPLAADAQGSGKVRRIGFLGNSTAHLESNLVEPFRQGLRDPATSSAETSSSSTDERKGSVSAFPSSSPS